MNTTNIKGTHTTTEKENNNRKQHIQTHTEKDKQPITKHTNKQRNIKITTTENKTTNTTHKTHKYNKEKET